MLTKTLILKEETIYYIKLTTENDLKELVDFFITSFVRKMISHHELIVTHQKVTKIKR